MELRDIYELEGIAMRGALAYQLFLHFFKALSPRRCPGDLCNMQTHLQNSFAC